MSGARVGVIARVLMLGVRGYQATLGVLMGGRCRFVPSCSVYALDALREHGAWRGGWMAARRVLRCHPWGGSGWDPVPGRCGCSSGEEKRDLDELEGNAVRK